MKHVTFYHEFRDNARKGRKVIDEDSEHYI